MFFPLVQKYDFIRSFIFLHKIPKCEMCQKCGKDFHIFQQKQIILEILEIKSCPDKAWPSV